MPYDMCCICRHHPMLKDHSDSEGLLLPQQHCVRPRLLPGPPAEGCEEGRYVRMSGRHAERPLYSTGPPARVCVLCTAMMGQRASSAPQDAPRVPRRTCPHYSEAGTQAMFWGKLLTTTPGSSNRCHGNRPPSLFQEECSWKEERTRQLWPFPGGGCRSREPWGRRPPPRAAPCSLCQSSGEKESGFCSSVGAPGLE